MTLALRLFFWDDADWTSEEDLPDVEVVSTPISGGSGHKRKRRKYIRADAHFWEVRERYLSYINTHKDLSEAPKHLLKPEAVTLALAKPSEITPPKIRNLQAKRENLFQLAKLSTDLEQLRQYGLKLREADKAIQTAKILQRRKEKAKKLKLLHLTSLGIALLLLLK